MSDRVMRVGAERGAPAWSMKAASMPVTPDEFRLALGHLAAGVSVVTAQLAGQPPSGMTVTSFTSLSLDPPLVLACIDKRVLMHDLLTIGQAFALNMLSCEQDRLSRRFAGKLGGDPFAEFGHTVGPGGVPVLEGALAVVGCRVVDRLPGGDHVIVVGEVHWTQIGAGEPLVHWRGKYGRVASL
jgi:flavin reductase (DIM6/NTAB) family NADH-FMN oxidoreductase RutF